jgi:hypothetical protein
MDPQTIITQLSPAGQAIFGQADPQTQQEMIQLASQSGVDALENALRDFANSVGIPYDQINAQAGQGGVSAPVAPAQGGPTGALPPSQQTGPAPIPADGDSGAGQLPTQVPPDVMASQGGQAAPLPGVPGGPPTDAQPPMSMQYAQTSYIDQGGKPTDTFYVETPKDWQPRDYPKSRYEKKNPTLERVLEDAKTGQQVWASRDLRIAMDTAMYHGTYNLTDDSLDDPSDGVILDDGSLFHRGANPYGLINRTAGVVAAFQDRITVHQPKRHESDPYVKAAQKFEDFSRGHRIEDEACWFQRGSTHGDPRPALPYEEAFLMALEGGFGWKWDVDPEDPDYPFVYELIPISELYPLGHACTRQFTMPLEMARDTYDVINKDFPLDENGSGRAFYETIDIRFIEWADNGGHVYCVAYQEDSIRGRAQQKNGWIIPPRKVGYGFPYFNYVIWNASAGTPNGYTRATHNAYVGYGVLTPLRKTYRLMDIMVSAIATGALKMQAPPLFRTVAEGRDMSKVPRLNLEAGSENKGRPDEKVTPLWFDIAATQAGVAFVQALAQELQNNIPPMLAGMTANSGFEYMQRSDDAHAMIIKPMVDAMQRSYEEMAKQRGVLAYRYARRGKDDPYKDKQFFSKYSYTGTDKKGYSYFGELKTADLRKSGVKLTVRYTEKSLTEQIQIASYVTQLVNAHLMSQEQALIKLGNDDPLAELKKIFQDASLMQPEMLKAITEEAIMASGSQALGNAWLRAFGQPAGSPPAQPGMASMASPGTSTPSAQPGGSQTQMPAQMTQPNATAQGQMNG